MSDILTSESGKRMLSYVSPIYDQSKVMQAIFECIGKEVDDLHTWCDDILNQFFPQTATWGLEYWENRLGIVTNTSLPIETRRKNILLKLATRTPVTPARLKSIIEAVSGVEADIVQNIAPYTFRVSLISQANGNIDVWQVNKTIKDTKPAHLAFELDIEAKVNINVGIKEECYHFEYIKAGIGLTGTKPDINTLGAIEDPLLNLQPEDDDYVFLYQMAGTKPDINTAGDIETRTLNADISEELYTINYPLCGTLASGQ